MSRTTLVRLRAVLDGIEARGGTLPSHEVLMRAAAYRELSPDKRDSSTGPGRAIVHYYDREPGKRYTVTLHVGLRRFMDAERVSTRREVITTARCSCAAGQHDTLCWHLLDALACAEADGLHLAR